MADSAPGSARPPELAAADITRLSEVFAGPIIGRGDPGYQDARRVWNGMIDRHPALIVQAATPEDVAPAVRFAREHDLLLAVRGGGHNIAGNGTVEGGMILDLGRLRDVDVDDRTRSVTVQAGATLAEVDAASVRRGLAVPIGVVSATGIAGLTLGGGVGWMTRAYGLTIDSLRSAEVVTATGDHVHTSETSHPDLFWGLRGGGGNFGVVTSFTFQAYPIPAKVLTGNLVYEPDHWRHALIAYAEWARDLPDEMTSILTFLTPPADWGIGTGPRMIVGFAWATSDTRRGHEVIDRLRAAAPADIDAVEPVAWTAWQSAVDDTFPVGSRGYWKNVSFDELDDPVIDVILAHAAEQTWVGTGFDIHHFGGAFGRMPEESTAFPNRSAQFWLNIYGFWTDPDDDRHHREFVRSLAADMEQFAAGGRYVNFQGDDPGASPIDAARDAYGPAKLRRLAEIKARWDPSNVFRLNHNITPASH